MIFRAQRFDSKGLGNKLYLQLDWYAKQFRKEINTDYTISKYFNDASKIDFSAGSSSVGYDRFVGIGLLPIPAIEFNTSTSAQKYLSSISIIVQ